MLTNLPSRVSVYEVSPRDGLQNESAQVATHAKVRLIEALADAGLRRIEATSFVSPRWVPQMADGTEVCRMLERREGDLFRAGAERAGSERAIEAGVQRSRSSSARPRRTTART
ncbi:MAG: hypothetical protein R3B99_12915 [Polyangiales bacterium]